MYMYIYIFIYKYACLPGSRMNVLYNVVFHHYVLKTSPGVPIWVVPGIYVAVCRSAGEASDCGAQVAHSLCCFDTDFLRVFCFRWLMNRIKTYIYIRLNSSGFGLTWEKYVFDYFNSYDLRMYVSNLGFTPVDTQSDNFGWWVGL